MIFLIILYGTCVCLTSLINFDFLIGKKESNKSLIFFLRVTLATLFFFTFIEIIGGILALISSS